MGGDLEANTLLCAYAQGIFPWFETDQEILW
ncbi:MAG: leucyl/phenylalanyl-tRNA--protein transferase, partial [Luminiphilus sp.]